MASRFSGFIGVIASLQKEIQRLKAAEMARFGLHGIDALIFDCLERHPDGLTASDVSREVGVDRSAISRALSSLVETGLVVVDDATTHGRYRAPVTLTERGLCLWREIRTDVEDLVAAVWRGIPEEDLETAYRVLKAMLDNLRTIATDRNHERLVEVPSNGS